MLPGKTLTPSDLIAIVRRRFWLIAIPPIVGLFVALQYAVRVPDMYQSDMLIAIDPQRVPDSFVRSTVTLGTDRRMNAILVQVTSRTTLERMIEAHNLYAGERQVLPIEDVVALMRGAIKVDLEQSRQEGPTAFHIRFTHRDPAVAAKVTQELGKLFVQQNTSDRGALAEATNTFLEEQLATARSSLERQEQKLEAFRQLHGKSLPSQMGANLQALQSMQLQVQSLAESASRDQDRLEVLERTRRDLLSEPAPAVTAAPGSTDISALRTARDQLAAARAQLATLERRYKADHPDVLRAKRVVEELEPLAEEETRALAAAGRSPSVVAPAGSANRDRIKQIDLDIEALQREVTRKRAAEERVRGEIADYQNRVDAVPGLESEWVALTRDYDTQQAAYKELLGKSQNARVAAALEEQQIGERFRVVDVARVPVHPLPAIRSKVNLGGLALGLLIGLGIAALLELRDTSFRTEDEVLEVLGLPVLAVIPRVENAAERQGRVRRAVLAGACAVAGVVTMGYVVWAQELWRGLR